MPLRRRRILAAVVLAAPLIALTAPPAAAAGELCGAITITPRCNEGGIPLFIPEGPTPILVPSAPSGGFDLSDFFSDLPSSFVFPTSDLLSLFDFGFLF